MKPKKVNKKLQLGKTDIANLADEEQQHLKGGYLRTNCFQTCETWCGLCATRPQVCGYSPEFTFKDSCW